MLDKRFWRNLIHHTSQHDELFRQWRSDWRPCLFRFHRVRYFVTGHNGSVANQPMTPMNEGTTKLSRIVSLIRTVKEEQRDVSSERHTAELGDFVNLPGHDSSFKILNETATEDTSSFHCPDIGETDLISLAVSMLVLLCQPLLKMMAITANISVLTPCHLQIFLCCRFWTEHFMSSF